MLKRGRFGVEQRQPARRSRLRRNQSFALAAADVSLLIIVRSEVRADSRRLLREEMPAGRGRALDSTYALNKTHAGLNLNRECLNDDSPMIATSLWQDDDCFDAIPAPQHDLSRCCLTQWTNGDENGPNRLLRTR